jgi:branched-chain amino acid transport system permease protein
LQLISLFKGFIQGSIYALIALGLTLVYGLLRILHVAHASLFTLGGYLGVLITNATGSLFLALILAMIVVGFVGMLSYRILYRPLLSQPPLIALIASIGIFIASEEIFRIIFGPFSISYVAAPLQNQIEILPGISMSEARIMVVLLAFVLLLGVNWLSRRTRLGIATRATVVDPDMAMSSGVNVDVIRYSIFFIGSAFAAAAGVMVSLLNNLVEPTMGAVPSYKALAIIVLGGLGSVRGALIASLLLGIIETFGTIYLDDLLDRDSIAFAFLILVLMIRPKGIFSKG